MTRAERVRLCMKRSRLTWHKICKNASVSESSLHRILAGADCRISTWERLAKALRVSPAYLLFGFQVAGQDVKKDTLLSLTVDPLICGDGNLQRFTAELQRGFPSNRIIVLQEGARLEAMK